MGAAGRKGRTQRARGRATRQRILRVAESMFAAGGYEATSLRQIATAADVDLATLKYHFGDKASLFGEVYRIGHGKFLELVEPALDRMGQAETRDDLLAFVDDLVKRVHDFMEENRTFVRLVLYRLLEDSSSIIGLEEALQGLALGMLDRAFQRLRDRNLIRPVDTRAAIVFLVAAVPMWFVAVEVKPSWFGRPELREEGGRDRSEAFLRDLLVQVLVPSAPEVGG